MNAQNYVHYGMTQRFYAWYAKRCCDYLDFGGFTAKIKEELLSLNWLTKRTARHEYFMSLTPRNYTYGNVGTGAETYQSQDFSPKTLELMQYLNDRLGTSFNVCFLNKYDNEKCHLGWHADNFAEMKADEPIAVVSFGAEREIWVKLKSQNGVIPPEQKIKLEEGSLFIMPAGYQEFFFHRIPKSDKPCGWRISLTFRSFN